MGSKKCKSKKKGDLDPIKEEKKYTCKKCNKTSNKEGKLCKPSKNK